jgi:hypothetical protein
MSDITDQIQRFVNGELSRDELVRSLVERSYPTPAYEKDYPTDPYEQWVRSEAADRFEDGTFGEVTKAWARQLLPDDVYMEILRARERRSKRPKPPTAFP